MNLFKRILPDIVVIILFAVISFAYFFPAVTEGRILSQHDSVAGIGAGEEAKEYLERTGERTRWTNSIFGGMPTYQMAPSYDSTDTLKGVEKLYHLYLPNYVWYVFVMLLGFYILLRAFDFSVWLASLGAVLWAFSSYFSINGTALPGVLYGETEIVDSQGHFLYMRRLSAPATLTWKSFKQGMLVCHQAFFARRDLVEPYDLRYRFSADFDWCIRIMKKADVLHNTHLTLIDYLNEGMTTRNHKASLKERFRIMSRHYGWASTVTHHLWFVLRLLYK